MINTMGPSSSNMFGNATQRSQFSTNQPGDML